MQPRNAPPRRQGAAANQKPVSRPPATPASASPAPLPRPRHKNPERRRTAGGQTCTLALPAPRPGWALRQTPPQVITAIDELLDHHTHAEIAAILNDRGLTSGEGRPFHPLIIRNIRHDYQLRSREQRLRDAGMLTLAEIAAQLGASTGTIKIWHHAGLLTGYPYNDKGQCLYPPPGPNPPARAQGRKLSERRPAAPTDDA